MSALFYIIPLEEENMSPWEIGDYKSVNRYLPHLKQIKSWLPKAWDSCEIQKTFDGVIKNQVESCDMTIKENKDGVAEAVVTAIFKPGFRLSEGRRNAFFDQMDAQMSDGFGESYDGYLIPDGDGWRLKLG